MNTLISNSVPKEALILAGGRGTRLASVLPDTPKPIAPVKGRPFLSYIVDHLVLQGVERIIISTGYKADQVKETMKLAHPRLELFFSEEREPLGTGGGIVHALPFIEQDNFIVLNGDTHFQFSIADLCSLHLEKRADLTIALKQVENAGRFGSVESIRNIVTGFNEKGRMGSGLINAGTYIVKRESLSSGGFPSSFSFESFLMPLWILTHRVACLPIEAPFLDLGVPEDYIRANDVLR